MENDNNDHPYFQPPTFTVENLSCEISAYHSEEDAETPLY